MAWLGLAPSLSRVVRLCGGMAPPTAGGPDGLQCNAMLTPDDRCSGEMASGLRDMKHMHGLLKGLKSIVLKALPLRLRMWFLNRLNLLPLSSFLNFCMHTRTAPAGDLV